MWDHIGDYYRRLSRGNLRISTTAQMIVLQAIMHAGDSWKVYRESEQGFYRVYPVRVAQHVLG